MTRFAFTAIPVKPSIGGAAAPVIGRREAADERSLRDELRRSGLVAIDVRPVSVIDALRSRWASDRLRASDSYWFFQTLALLLDAAVPLESALTSMTELAPTPRMKAAAERVRESVRGGKGLAEAVEGAPGLASPRAIAMMRAGHESGRLSHAVKLIEQSLGRAEKLKRTVYGKLAYPVLVLVVAFGVLWYLAVSVIPRFADVLSALGGELPVSTWLTLTIAPWFVWLAPIVAAAAWLAYAQRETIVPREWREKLAERSLTWPLVGPLVWSAQGGLICDVTGTMLEGGGDVLGGLEQAERVVWSPVIIKRLSAARKRVREGIEPGEALADEGVLPPIAATVVRIGMRSGDLAQSLKRAAELCAEQQERAAQRLVMMLEPLTIVVLAVTVGWVIFSLVQGMMALNRAGTL